jgi:hypothetical protein
VVSQLGNVILFAVLGTGFLLAVATLVGALLRLSKVRFTLVEGAAGLVFFLCLCAICLTLFGIEMGFRQLIYEGCLIRRSTPGFANFLLASIFAPYGLIAVGAYLWHLNSSAYEQAKEKLGKKLGSSILDTLDFYRGEPLALITQATAFAGIHIFFNALVLSMILLQPLQGLAFGTTNYDRFHTSTYAEGCVPYGSSYQKY